MRKAIVASAGVGRDKVEREERVQGGALTDGEG